MADPPYTGLWRFLYDWQTGIAGVFALIAAAVAYGVGKMQLRAGKERDRQQAHALAVGIWPDLLLIRVRHGRASKAVDDFTTWAVAFTGEMAPLIRAAKIGIPPLLDRFTEQLGVIEDGGPAILQLVSVVIQYDGMVETLATEASENHRFRPHDAQTDLRHHLRIIRQLLNEIEPALKPVHDGTAS